MPSIAPFLWFDTQAEQAARFYVSVFGRSRIVAIARYGDAGPGPAGSVMTVGFELEGQPFTALNGGPVFSFTPAISLVVDCDTQAEIDTLWERLADGGSPQRCGWLQDRWGVSWQVVPPHGGLDDRPRHDQDPTRDARDAGHDQARPRRVATGV